MQEPIGFQPLIWYLAAGYIKKFTSKVATSGCACRNLTGCETSAFEPIQADNGTYFEVTKNKAEFYGRSNHKQSGSYFTGRSIWSAQLSPAAGGVEQR